ncbi:MAG: NADH-quinone oxidoreductase subunit L [Acidimicrobiia bacterium]|nr:NADH-quinone oxidoreductase subunit L [Acidimicrobiia bacterium]
MVELVWLIPALPLAGFLLLLFLGKRIGEPRAGWIGTATVALSFVVAVITFIGLWNEPEHTYELQLFDWIPAGKLQVGVGFLLDPLSMAMILFITGISALIHLYSIGYMHGDERFARFFTYLNLFVASMAVLVLGDNLVLTFLGWEGVGTCSYFLISFWFQKDANASAGKKAFITNRVGDWGFMIGIFLTFFVFGTVTYTEFLPLAPGLAASTATFIGLMILVGAVGKSAQIPLYIWLPDAMAGPTPVSALIHAATMVTAGVYVLIRINPILAASYSWLPMTIAIIGVATAFLAATIAMAQNDIKKVLAYSTISQIGYMFLAVGVAGYAAGLFHMITHAAFKACLFLGAGSVIHGMHGEQDMRRMGGLRKWMPVTAITFLVSWLAIAGVIPFSGFWSKDDVLSYALHKNVLLYIVGLLTAAMTAFYMSRLVFKVFFGPARWGDTPESVAAFAEVGASTTVHGHGDDHGDDHAADGATGGTDPLGGDFHPHESPPSMTIPLVVLGFLAAVLGVLNLPFTDQLQFLGRWLEPVVGANEAHFELSGAKLTFELVLSTVVAVGSIVVAYFTYLRPRLRARWFEPRLFAEGWYYDKGITAFVGGLGRRGFDAIATFDRVVIDGAVNGVARATRGGAARLRTIENGYVRWYALLIGVGAALMVAFVLTQVSF